MTREELEARIRELEQERDTWEIRFTTNMGRVTDLQAQLQAVTQDRDTLKACYVKEAEGGTILQQQIAAITQERDQLRKMKTVLRKELKCAFMKIKTLQGNLSAEAKACIDVTDEADALQSQLAQLQARNQVLTGALRTMVDCFGALHEEECPEDDTCDCKWKPTNELIDAALAHKPSPGEGGGAVKKPLDSPEYLLKRAETIINILRVYYPTQVGLAENFIDSVREKAVPHKPSPGDEK